MELLLGVAGGMEQLGLSNVWRDPCLCLSPQCTSLLGKGDCVVFQNSFQSKGKNDNFSSENRRGSKNLSGSSDSCWFSTRL